MYMVTYESDEERLNNEGQKHTIAMIMPSNGHVYVELNQRSFNAYICDWVGVAHECYILRARNIDESLTCFQHSPCDDIVNESDDESGFDSSPE